VGLAILGLIVLVLSFVIVGLNKRADVKTNLGPTAWIMRVVGILMIIGGPLYSSVVQIPAGYRGVLLRFTAVQGQLDEGIHLITPGVNTVVLMETRTQKEESVATAASRDLQTVSTKLVLNYRIDPSKVSQLYNNVGVEYRARIIDPVVQESVKLVTARYTAEELIRKRADVKSEMEREITNRLRAYDVLVDPSGLSITNFDFSPEFNKAIEAKQVAQQEAEKQRYVLAQAELEKQTEVARAEGRAQAAKLNAEALRVQGAGLVIAREWIEKWDGRLPSVSAGGGGASGGSFIIDLGSLMREGQVPNR